MLRVGEIVIPSVEHTNWWSNIKWSILVVFNPQKWKPMGNRDKWPILSKEECLEVPLEKVGVNLCCKNIKAKI